jgi:hypothetical protein
MFALRERKNYSIDIWEGIQLEISSSVNINRAPDTSKNSNNNVIKKISSETAPKLAIKETLKI